MKQTAATQAMAPGKRTSGGRMLPPDVGRFNIPLTPAKPQGPEAKCATSPGKTKPHGSDDKFTRPLMAYFRVPAPPEEQHNGVRVIISALSFIFNASMLAALTGPLLMLSISSNLDEKQVYGIPFGAQLADDQGRQVSAKLVVTNQKGIAGEPLPLGLVIKDGSGGETVTISGLPEGIELSFGTSLGTGKWVVSSNDLDLTYVASLDPSLTFLEAAAELYSSAGRLVDIRNIQFEWLKNSEGEASPDSTLAKHFQTSTSERLEPEPEVIGGDFGSHGEQSPSSTFEIAQLPHASGTPEVPTQQQILDSDRALEMLKLGKDFLNRGDIAAARVVFEHAVTGKNAQAALELAMTFDSYFLNKWGAVGTIGDEAKARTWYQEAMKLGSTEASTHLNRLSRKPHQLSIDRGRPW